MTLAFSTHWSKKMRSLAGLKTCFVDKITNCMWKYQSKEMNDFALKSDYREDIYTYTTPAEIEEISPKLHTIRQDSKNRWQPGKLIHPVINNRTKDRFQFAPTIKCISVQQIEIVYSDEELCEQHCIEPVIKIDGRVLGIEECDQLAINDGFDDIQKFLWWFNEDFKGKIIHWTDFKY
ncbi:hypothetical protein [Aquimarina sp. 2201CG5-10]|uniref:hypothetical protein n=1 Tax=Aquimarina callyspongiae TaxID=3098150 RepID=UPI002AB46281|nr:hypothetical protein [Aquimarina sp. 2201CG5-10]MDY8137583.1 hypothetical protein [Aquimarina sp. 2201CG5-10]